MHGTTIKKNRIIFTWTYRYPVLKLITGIHWIKLLLIHFCSVLDSWHFPQFPPRYIHMLTTATFYEISGSSPMHRSCTSCMPRKVMQLLQYNLLQRTQRMNILVGLKTIKIVHHSPNIIYGRYRSQSIENVIIQWLVSLSRNAGVNSWSRRQLLTGHRN